MDDWAWIVVHPQTGTICSAYRQPAFWPDEGFLSPAPGRDYPVIWPVPRLIDARLVECPTCQKTGVQPRTWEAAARYIPGAELKEGQLVIKPFTALATVSYPTGSGEDENDLLPF